MQATARPQKLLWQCPRSTSHMRCISGGWYQNGFGRDSGGGEDLHLYLPLQHDHGMGEKWSLWSTGFVGGLYKRPEPIPPCPLGEWQPVPAT